MLMHDSTKSHAREFKTTAHEPAAQETVAGYLNKRLRQIGVGHVFAIPGDYIAEYVATLDDPDLNAGLIRVHPNNEMCATYAADGYGRANNSSVGCVAFTYGVGAINAAQAVAGAYVERVPLVLINGSPSIAQFNSKRDQGVLYHHMLDGSHTDQRIFEELTEMTVRIDNPATAPALIDAALTTCITASRPVYIEIVNQTGGLACAPIPDNNTLAPAPVPVNAASLKEAADAVEAHLQAATSAVVIAGSEVARSGLQDQLAQLLQVMDVPYVTSPLGKSVLSEFDDDLRFSGVYFGKSSPSQVQDLMTSADCVLALGVQDTDFNYLGVVTPDYKPGGDLPGPTHIQARDGAVLVGRQLAYWGDVGLAALLDELLHRFTGSGKTLPGSPFPGLESVLSIPEPSEYEAGGAISYDSFKSLLHHEFLANHDDADYPQIIAD